MAYLIGCATAASMALFLGILWWACSQGRQLANRESANLPFALPDEGARQTGSRTTPAGATRP